MAAERFGASSKGIFRATATAFETHGYMVIPPLSSESFLPLRAITDSTARAAASPSPHGDMSENMKCPEFSPPTLQPRASISPITSLSPIPHLVNAYAVRCEGLVEAGVALDCGDYRV